MALGRSIQTARKSSPSTFAPRIQLATKAARKNAPGPSYFAGSRLNSETDDDISGEEDDVFSASSEDNSDYPPGSDDDDAAEPSKCRVNLGRLLVSEFPRSVRSSKSSFIMTAFGPADEVPTAPGLAVDGIVLGLPVCAPSLARFTDSTAPVLEINHSRLSFLNPAWPAGVKALVDRKVCPALRCPASSVTFAPLSLIVCGPGEQRLPSQPPIPNQFATLTIQLPSVYSGGSLVVSDATRSEMQELACNGTGPYTVWYTAQLCGTHQTITPITEGYRTLVLYALLWTAKDKPPPAVPRAPTSSGATGEASSSLCASEDVVGRMTAVLSAWDLPPTGVLVLPLSGDSYTSEGMAVSFDSELTGSDLELWKLIKRVNGTLPPARQLNVMFTHLTQMTVLCHSVGWHEQDKPLSEWKQILTPSDYEEITNTVKSSEWVDSIGGKYDWPEFELCLPSKKKLDTGKDVVDLVSPKPFWREVKTRVTLDDMGVTKNIECSRSVLVLWPTSAHVDVILEHMSVHIVLDSLLPSDGSLPAPALLDALLRRMRYDEEVSQRPSTQFVLKLLHAFTGDATRAKELLKIMCEWSLWRQSKPSDIIPALLQLLNSTSWSPARLVLWATELIRETGSTERASFVATALGQPHGASLVLPLFEYLVENNDLPVELMMTGMNLIGWDPLASIVLTAVSRGSVSRGALQATALQEKGHAAPAAAVFLSAIQSTPPRSSAVVTHRPVIDSDTMRRCVPFLEASSWALGVEPLPSFLRMLSSVQVTSDTAAILLSTLSLQTCPDAFQSLFITALGSLGVDSPSSVSGVAIQTDSSIGQTAPPWPLLAPLRAVISLCGWSPIATAVTTVIEKVLSLPTALAVCSDVFAKCGRRVSEQCTSTLVARVVCAIGNKEADHTMILGTIQLCGVHVVGDASCEKPTAWLRAVSDKLVSITDPTPLKVAAAGVSKPQFCSSSPGGRKLAVSVIAGARLRVIEATVGIAPPDGVSLRQRYAVITEHRSLQAFFRGDASSFDLRPFEKVADARAAALKLTKANNTLLGITPANQLNPSCYGFSAEFTVIGTGKKSFVKVEKRTGLLEAETKLWESMSPEREALCEALGIPVPTVAQKGVSAPAASSSPATNPPPRIPAPAPAPTLPPSGATGTVVQSTLSAPPPLTSSTRPPLFGFPAKSAASVPRPLALPYVFMPPRPPCYSLAVTSAASLTRPHPTPLPVPSAPRSLTAPSRPDTRAISLPPPTAQAVSTAPPPLVAPAQTVLPPQLLASAMSQVCLPSFPFVAPPITVDTGLPSVASVLLQQSTNVVNIPTAPAVPRQTKKRPAESLIDLTEDDE